MFNERQKRILQAVTIDYIYTAEPVGSRTIARKYNLGVSPATIRNEMYELEEAGYLQQPHTSAGRIPSDLGYRFYVDVLMEPEVFDDAQVEEIRSGLALSSHDLAILLHQAVKLLSSLTRYTAVLIGPVTSKRIFKNLGLVRIDDFHALAVLVTEPNLVENSTIELEQPLSDGELATIAATVSELLQGRDLNQLTTTINQQLRHFVPQKALYEALVRLMFTERGPKNDQVIIEGTTHLLDQPEFTDLSKAKAFLRAMEGKELLLNILGDDTTTSGLKVRIGKENQVDEFQECSIVTATYEYNGQPLGTIGIFGPTRLDYAKTTTAVSVFAQLLGELLEEVF
ncbi:MAG: heat-inducible transcription repressor HrcA [Firmicutes bacterium]|nr:heat-inducible transcription repressor HrcA [Bacillota bacterium]